DGGYHVLVRHRLVAGRSDVLPVFAAHSCLPVIASNTNSASLRQRHSNATRFSVSEIDTSPSRWARRRQSMISAARNCSLWRLCRAASRLLVSLFASPEASDTADGGD